LKNDIFDVRFVVWIGILCFHPTVAAEHLLLDITVTEWFETINNLDAISISNLLCSENDVTVLKKEHWLH
jgi:hypothetical protein